MTDPDSWQWVYQGWDADLESRRETLCTVGNGYFATRGAASETDADGIHYPGTYIAGVYNRLSAELSGRTVENESIVNAPNWLPLSFRCEGGFWLGADGTELLSQRQELDMYHGMLVRRTRWRDGEGHILQITERRFVSMRDHHVAALQTTVIAENWDGRLEVRSALDGTVTNDNVARYRGLGGTHLRALESGGDGSGVIWTEVETKQSHIRIAAAARTRLFRHGRQLQTTYAQSDRNGYAEQLATVEVTHGEPVVVEKAVALFTSRDMATSEPLWEAREWVSKEAASFDELAERHALAWAQLWRRSRIRIGADHGMTRLLNLYTFHILQTLSENTIGLDVGIPARGLHGEAYRGHVFWDELFVFRFLCLRLPELARSLLLYRYRRLDQARRAARSAGLAGAMFPWQSGSDGREETQVVHLNPLSGRWRPDPSRLQRHSNAAIVVSIWQYYQATGDLQFLLHYGAEMIFEIARFWSYLATHDPERDRYEIKGVMGPDEYHEAYPGRDQPGVNNNAYTNLMAVWCLCRALDVLKILPRAFASEITERLGIHELELDRWARISRKMRVCFHDGVISQFEGYELLEELDWDGYRRKYGDISRLDRILEAEGDSPNRYKLSKQADVIMLFYVLSAEELAHLLERLGYRYDKELIHRNFEYYAARTAHGSTLSKVVHAWVAARRDRPASWDFFLQALYSDALEDTTAEGIHLGAMAGTLDLLQRCYTGLEFGHDVLYFNPVIPNKLCSVAFDIRYRGRLLHLHFTPQQTRVEVDLAEGAPVMVDIAGTRATLTPGQSMEIKTLAPDDEVGVE